MHKRATSKHASAEGENRKSSKSSKKKADAIKTNLDTEVQERLQMVFNEIIAAGRRVSIMAKSGEFDDEPEGHHGIEAYSFDQIVDLAQNEDDDLSRWIHRVNSTRTKTIHHIRNAVGTAHEVSSGDLQNSITCSDLMASSATRVLFRRADGTPPPRSLARKGPVRAAGASRGPAEGERARGTPLSEPTPASRRFGVLGVKLTLHETELLFHGLVMDCGYPKHRQILTFADFCRWQEGHNKQLLDDHSRCLLCHVLERHCFPIEFNYWEPMVAFVLELLDDEAEKRYFKHHPGATHARPDALASCGCGNAGATNFEYSSHHRRSEFLTNWKVTESGYCAY